MAKFANIPIIDISGNDQTQVAKDLVEAAIEHGFVYIKNTGEDIPAEAIDGAFEIVIHHTSFAVEDDKYLTLRSLRDSSRRP
jgi:isopenicillin N synthase-like dioxygenase